MARSNGEFGFGFVIGALVMAIFVIGIATLWVPNEVKQITCDLGGNKSLTIKVDEGNFTIPSNENIKFCSTGQHDDR